MFDEIMDENVMKDLALNALNEKKPLFLPTDNPIFDVYNNGEDAALAWFFIINFLNNGGSIIISSDKLASDSIISKLTDEEKKNANTGNGYDVTKLNDETIQHIINRYDKEIQIYLQTLEMGLLTSIKPDVDITFHRIEDYLLFKAVFTAKQTGG